MRNKILVYVDAENISVEKFSELQEMVRNDMTENSIVIGKFYGSHSVLGSIVSVCYDAGFEFVDTYMLGDSKKNVTDMKMTVDCICDVVSLYTNEVSVVYVASSDHDFVPLVHKLRSQQCKVVMPFLNSSVTLKTCADLSKDLINKNFDIIARERILDNPFDMIRGCASDDFKDDVIEAFVSKKQRKVAAEVASLLSIVDSENVMSIPPTEFTYDRLKAVIGEDRISCFDLLDVYTKKMYGICLPRALAEMMLEERREKSA